VYETAPVGYLDQPAFLNQVIAVETSLDAPSLLSVLLDVERSLGRVRTIRNGPRTIDLDILLFGDNAVDLPNLTIPHPRMLDRRFVLEPLSAIAPTLRHPLTGETIAHHFQILVDKETI
jgi:2-amino-4-hydroxy-6-hydroxymethyldihydropteridine diphosphokinase